MNSDQEDPPIQRTDVRLAWTRGSRLQDRILERMAANQLRFQMAPDPDVPNESRRREFRKRRKTLTELHLTNISRPLTSYAVKYVRNREYGISQLEKSLEAHREFCNVKLPDFVSQHLPAVLQEKEFDFGTRNKIFASKWLNDSQVVLGTKCNKLMVMDVRNNNLVEIQSLKSSNDSQPAECPCGIHSLAINPSRTMLATGGKNTNDLAVYELPTFDPLCVGEQAHKDWIFDMEWIDDEHIVTGSRDSSIALWRVDCQGLSTKVQGKPHPLGHRLIKPCITKQCKEAYRVRALALGRNKELMGVLSMNAMFHFFDIHTFKQLDSEELHWKRENVCVASSDDIGLFAVGSQAYVTLIDHRSDSKSRKRWIQVPSRNGERGVRSVGFNQNMITIGTGDGRMLFYDTRNSQFLETQEGNSCELKVGDGWLRDDANYREHFVHGYYPNAVYTHCYDEWKARLFVAGGPLPTGLYGNYAGLFY
ncbi:unnamed protein product [Candidula unifasciata]|uniref:DDB1- and CUL4-associated factor 12 beta-propeller domain-containing protein n=1 Tax=Candidula unifasciata TaxID=100452 RepID=A0A8S3Z2Z3_9EUPU|nr:unnamed protein product [Candidula unifasciata]